MILASKTGWTEDFIRWQLPLRRGLAYYHAARLMEGERCRWPQAAAQTDQWIDEMRFNIRAAVKRHVNHDNEV